MCEDMICPNDCNGNGKCHNFKCLCNPGWEGEECNRKGCSIECKNGGYCFDGKCACPSGYKGESCA